MGVRVGMRWGGGTSSLLGLSFALTLALAPGAANSAERRPEFPRASPTTRAEAAVLLAEPGAAGCQTPNLLLIPPRVVDAGALERPAVRLLADRRALRSESRLAGPGEITIRYTLARQSPDRIHDADRDGDGRPDTLQTVTEALEDVHALLVDGMSMAPASDLDVVLVELGDRLDGYLVRPVRLGRTTLAIDATPRCASSGIRRTVVQLYARAIAQADESTLPAGWSESFANWVSLALDGVATDHDAFLLDRRIDRLASGLLGADAALSGTNTLWLAFLAEHYGPSAVRATIDELGSGDDVAVALDRALRSVDAAAGLDTAFREFQLWALLVGSRSDGRHFSFASRLADPAAASVADSLPALTVQSNPPVAPYGADHVVIRPTLGKGGMRVVFDGNFSARWDADLLLYRNESIHRVPLDLTDHGRGEVTVPLSGVSEALLLVRNLGSDDGAGQRYTVTAHAVARFPFELTASDVRVVAGRKLLVGWTTSGDENVAGYNLLRFEDGQDPSARRVNPVWIPALGRLGESTSYQFVDADADPQHPHLYRVEGITHHGLRERSTEIQYMLALPATPRNR